MSKIIVKSDFEILSGIQNCFDTFPSTDNAEDYQSILMSLKLMKNNVKHFSKELIYSEYSNLQDIKKRIKVTNNLPKYPLPISYINNKKQFLINLHPLAKSEISEVNPKILYALLVYGDSFSYFVENPSSFSEQYSSYIISYLMTIMVRLFGRKYGFLGNRSDRIPQLKFLLSCYVLTSFFGYKNNDDMKMEASKLSGISYNFLTEDLSKYDISSIKVFVELLSKFDIMTGINIYEFTSVIVKLLGLNAIPMFEDCSRFLSILVTSTVPSVQFLPNYLYTYNTEIFLKIINVIKSEMK